MTQWHPIFDDLLRRALQDYYEVQTNVAVGDLPREADIVVVRRSSAGRPPFRTLWKHLTRWNVLEFKGRSESARVADVDLLVEVGLGIHRRLQEESDARVPRSEVSFWYLANHLGKRFLRGVIELTGGLESVGPGLWRGRLLGRPLWLVSNGNVSIDAESAPVSVVSAQSAERALELARVVVASEKLWQVYGPLLGNLFPHHRKELEDMATKRGRKPLDWGSLARSAVDSASPKALAEAGTPQAIVEKMGPDGFLASLTPEQRRELSKQLETGKK
jgi:hypothetical protein